MKRILDKKSRLLLINSLVLSHLHNCSLIWGHCSLTAKNMLQRSVNFAAKVACDGTYRKRDHVTPLLKSLQWLSVNNIIKANIATFMHKALFHSAHPNKIEFKARQDVTGRKTRGCTQIDIARCRTETGKKNMATTGAAIWNKLPRNIKEKKTAHAFKKYLNEHFLREQWRASQSSVIDEPAIRRTSDTAAASFAAQSSVIDEPAIRTPSDTAAFSSVSLPTVVTHSANLMDLPTSPDQALSPSSLSHSSQPLIRLSALAKPFVMSSPSQITN